MFDVFGQSTNNLNKSEFDFNSELKATDAFADKIEISDSGKSAFLQKTNASNNAKSAFGNMPSKKDDVFGKMSGAKKDSVFNKTPQTNNNVQNKLNRKTGSKNAQNSSVFNQKARMQRNPNVSARKGNIQSKKPVNKTMMMVNIIKTSALYEKTKDGGYFIA